MCIKNEKNDLKYDTILNNKYVKNRKIKRLLILDK